MSLYIAADNLNGRQYPWLAKKYEYSKDAKNLHIQLEMEYFGVTEKILLQKMSHIHLKR